MCDLAPQILDVDGFIARVEPYFEKNGFYEMEIARRTEQFGRLAQVWSTYESRHDPADPEPYMRGINSIQLFNDGNRWWILNIYWQQESDEHPIPEKYLGNDPPTPRLRRRNDPAVAKGYGGHAKVRSAKPELQRQMERRSA